MKHALVGWLVGVALLAPIAATAGAKGTEAHDVVQRIVATAKTEAFASLSVEHRTKVQEIVDRVSAGSLPRRAAIRQIDDVLSPDEATAEVRLAERTQDQLRAAFRTPHEGSAPERKLDAGAFLLNLSSPPRRALPPEPRSTNAP